MHRSPEGRRTSAETAHQQGCTVRARYLRLAGGMERKGTPGVWKSLWPRLPSAEQPLDDHAPAADGEVKVTRGCLLHVGPRIRVNSTHDRIPTGAGELRQPAGRPVDRLSARML